MGFFFGIVFCTFRAPGLSAYPFWGDEHDGILADLVNPGTAINYYNTRDPIVKYLKDRQQLDGEAITPQIKFYTLYLEDKEGKIATDAFRHLANLPFESLRDSVELFPLLKLRRWVRDNKIPFVRRDYYAFILGLNHHPEDKNLLAEITDDFAVKSSAQGGSMVGTLAGYAVSGSNFSQQMFLKMVRFDPAPHQQAQDALTALEFVKENLPGKVDAWVSTILKAAFSRPLVLQMRALDLASRWNDPALSKIILDRLKKDGTAMEVRQAAVSYCEVINDEPCKQYVLWMHNQGVTQTSDVPNNSSNSENVQTNH